MTFTMQIKVTSRGPAPKHLRKIYTKSSKVAWADTGKFFHSTMRDKRFSKQHARTARYVKRRGEEPGLSEKDYRRSYTGQKERKFGHTRPLEFSGETRRMVKAANITSTSKGGKVRYPGARKFNFRNRHSSINMAKEFRHLTADEKRELAKHYDGELDREMRADNTQTTEVI